MNPYNGPSMPGIDREVKRAMAEYTAAVERACEAAVQSGTKGVLMVKHQDGSFTIGPSDLVAYGRMVEIPEAGLEPWIANGCPS